ncbi:hypothetical protein ACHAWF_005944 [Thalassiosira exigua]
MMATVVGVFCMLALSSRALLPCAYRSPPVSRALRGAGRRTRGRLGAGVAPSRASASTSSSPPVPSLLDEDDSSPRRDDSGARTALLWLSSNRLRLRDNASLTRAAELGPDGLTICVAWPHRVPTSPSVKRDEITPAEAFGYAALQAFDDALGERGQRVWLISSQDEERECDPTSIIARAARELQPSHVVVDVSLLDRHRDPAAKLRSRLQDTYDENTNHVPGVVEVMDDGLLISFDDVPKALGRSRRGGRALRWSTFLGNALANQEKIDKPIWTTPALPPLMKNVEKIMPHTPIPSVRSFPSWARHLLSDWGEVSEDEAISRASANKMESHSSSSSSPLTERGSRDTKLSPYLRWGLISPQRAAESGVRKRDLLWRDWSYVCYHLLEPIKRGDAVLEFMDEARRSSNAPSGDDEELFKLWCVGNTGSKLVDAGMRQLWAEGWMPRRVRLLAAGCLVEGLGLDWRTGRDWFERTLVDHDPAINEMMWQNAGLAGVDPFYHGIKWEALPNGQEDDEYVDIWTNRELVWPSSLNAYSAKEPPLQLIDGAESQRQKLRANGVYKAARKVSNAGVRIAWPGLSRSHANSQVKNGEVIGVGIASVNELRV